MQHSKLSPVYTQNTKNHSKEHPMQQLKETFSQKILHILFWKKKHHAHIQNHQSQTTNSKETTPQQNTLTIKIKLTYQNTQNTQENTHEKEKEHRNTQVWKDAERPQPPSETPPKSQLTVISWNEKEVTPKKYDISFLKFHPLFKKVSVIAITATSITLAPPETYGKKADNILYHLYNEKNEIVQRNNTGKFNHLNPNTLYYVRISWLVFEEWLQSSVVKITPRKKIRTLPEIQESMEEKRKDFWKKHFSLNIQKENGKITVSHKHTLLQRKVQKSLLIQELEEIVWNDKSTFMTAQRNIHAYYGSYIKNIMYHLYDTKTGKLLERNQTGIFPLPENENKNYSLILSAEIWNPLTNTYDLIIGKKHHYIPKIDAKQRQLQNDANNPLLFPTIHKHIQEHLIPSLHIQNNTLTCTIPPEIKQYIFPIDNSHFHILEIYENILWKDNEKLKSFKKTLHTYNTYVKNIMYHLYDAQNNTLVARNSTGIFPLLPNKNYFLRMSAEVWNPQKETYSLFIGKKYPIKHTSK